MDKSLKGKIIILTGANGLLGKEYESTLHKAGAKVIPIDITSEKGTYHMDITDETAIKLMCKDVIEDYDKIDILINNAMYNPVSKKMHCKFEDFQVEDWNKLMAVNLTGPFMLCREVGKQMVKQGYGNIINISSTYGVVAPDQRIYGKSGINSSVAYGVSKAGIIQLTKYLASYWGNKGIRVNCLTPGGVLSETTKDEEFVKNYEYRTMLGRMANKKDYCGAILFLCSDASSYMTGSNLIIDGGWTAW